MFRAIRLKLIAYVAAVLATVLVAVGGLVYVLLTHQFDAAVETQLQSHLPSIAPFQTQFNAGPAPITSCVLGAPADAAPLSASGFSPGVSVSCEGGAAAPAATQAQPDDRSNTRFLISGVVSAPNDGTFVTQSVAGQLIKSDGGVPEGLPDLAALAAARPGHDDERTVHIHGQRYRLRTRTVSMPAPGPIPMPVLTVQAGISLANRDREERTVVLALTAGGLFGIVLTVAGGLFLTDRALAPLQLAFDRQRRFVADASHELRTPIALVRLEAEDLAGRTNSAEETRPLLRQVRRVSELVDNLLTLAQLDQGVLAVELEPVHVETILSEATLAASRLAAAGVQVETSAPPDLWVNADRGRLYQILLILVDNACRATPAGGRIELAARAERGMVAFAVSDTGAGIPPAHLRQVFERFHRVDEARSRGRGGTGLGLAIARELAGAQKGRIDLTSTLSVGTVAVLRLPMAHAPSFFDPELEPVWPPTEA